MTPDCFSQIIKQVDQSREPRIAIIKRAEATGARVGVFAASFNPPTIAHVELIARARKDFSLDEMLALAGVANADKTSYEATLEDRLEMLALAFEGDPHTSIGLSSHAYYVDKVDALASLYGDKTDLHFVIGFDTFVRVLDSEDKYTPRYHSKFSDRLDALSYLLKRSRFIVASRAGARLDDLRELIAGEPRFIRERILYLDFPDDLAEQSATDVRNRVKEGLSVSGLVPRQVEQYIYKRELYKRPC